MPFVHHPHSVFRLMSNTNTTNKKKRVSSRTDKRKKGGNVSLVEKTDIDIELTDDDDKPVVPSRKSPPLPAASDEDSD